MSTEDYIWFLRFYDQLPSVIFKCEEKLRQLGYTFTTHTHPVKKLNNDPQGFKKLIQVDLIFSVKSELEKFLDDREAERIYISNSVRRRKIKKQP